MKKIICLFIFCTIAFAQPPRPYPIYDLRSGRISAVEPWLLPSDGFETLNNCYLKRGILEKRYGYSSFGQLVSVTTTSPTMAGLTSNPIMGIWNHFEGATEQLLIMDQDRVNKYVSSASQGRSITGFANGSGGIVLATCTTHGFTADDVITISGTTNYNGTFSVVSATNANQFSFRDTWVSDDGTGTASEEQFMDVTRHKIRYKHGGTQNWQPAVGETISGNTSSATGTVEAVFADTGTFGAGSACGTIIFQNASYSGTFTDGEALTEYGTPANILGVADGVNSDDVFTGDNTNYFWVENWNDVTYITNNNDVIQKYESPLVGTDATLSRLHIDLDVEGGPDNDVTRCRFIYLFKSRLILFDTTEKGTAYHQRARWCDINDPDTWKSASYVDADTEDWIMAGDFIGDDLIIFFEGSIWKFSYTADATAPFRWDRIDTTEGCYAPMSLVAFSDEIFGVGQTQIVGTDGREAYGIDEKIPDFVLSWDTDSVAYCYGLVLEEEKQAWITYASLGASSHADGNIYPDKILILNYEDNSWSTHTMATHSLGYSEIESDLTWNDVTDAWEDIEWAWNERTIQAGYPTTLMGARDGKVYKLNDTNADDGSSIEFEAISGHWNPFYNDGKKAWFTYLDVLVDVATSTTFQVQFYKDTESSSYRTATVTCTPIGSSTDKSWHRVNVNQIATFHQIEITNNSNQRPRIHCITPWFKEGPSVF